MSMPKDISSKNEMRKLDIENECGSFLPASFQRYGGFPKLYKICDTFFKVLLGINSAF